MAKKVFITFEDQMFEPFWINTVRSYETYDDVEQQMMHFIVINENNEGGMSPITRTEFKFFDEEVRNTKFVELKEKLELCGVVIL